MFLKLIHFLVLFFYGFFCATFENSSLKDTSEEFSSDFNGNLQNLRSINLFYLWGE